LLDGKPITMMIAAGVSPSRHSFLRSRLPDLAPRQVYSDTLHNILAGPATAALKAMEAWLSANNERELLDYLKWERHARATRSRIIAGTVFSLLIAFRLVASFVWVVLYGVGALLLFPVAVVIWGLSNFGALPGLPNLVLGFKRRLDVLLLTTVGDINLFMRHPDQAQLARCQ